jgi:predicted cobalt transporter CbtA
MIPSTLRQWHAYLGLFIAPSVLFFALTGLVQIFNLHEAHGGYRPAVLVEKLSAVHKDQIFEAPRERPAPDPGAAHAAHAAADQPADEGDEKQRVSTYVLKWLFAFVSLGLITSTLIGIWMGATQIRRKGLAWTLLIAGTLAPIAILVI